MAMEGRAQTLNVVLLGDSNTSIGGDSCQEERGWTPWFKEAIGATTCRSYARSGATWTNTASTRLNIEENIGVIGNDNVVYNQIRRLVRAFEKGEQVEPDLIIIGAGTNDAWFADQRPGAFSLSPEEAFADLSGFITTRDVATVLSLAESVRYGCEMLMEAFPGAQIVLLTPHQTTMAPAARLRQTGDIIEECGHRMSLAVIRQDHLSGIYPARENACRTLTSDGTHTRPEGARRAGRLIARQIMSLLQM